MRLAIVKTETAPLYPAADEMAVLADEVLGGMVVELHEDADGGWCKVRTAYGCEGFVPAACLHQNDADARQWQAVGKQVARSPWLDVMAEPKAASARVAALPRGGLLRPVGAPDEDGWVAVALGDGRTGYAKQGNLMPQLTSVPEGGEDQLREALAMTALSYLGTQYRTGGKTPLGIDCAGLVSVTYLLNGGRVWRGPEMKEGYDLRPISREALKMGDVLFFGGHLALFLGDGKYVHATSQNGSDGVVINSLQVASPFYREDLAERLSACGSIFPRG